MSTDLASLSSTEVPTGLLIGSEWAVQPTTLLQLSRETERDLGVLVVPVLVARDRRATAPELTIFSLPVRAGGTGLP
jgi:hypothetical protein